MGNERADASQVGMSVLLRKDRHRIWLVVLLLLLRGSIVRKFTLKSFEHRSKRVLRRAPFQRLFNLKPGIVILSAHSPSPSSAEARLNRVRMQLQCRRKVMHGGLPVLAV